MDGITRLPLANFLLVYTQSLVLLEYLVKNGSERVVDDARSHISMIKMMKNFHYIDEKGKDQGLNGTKGYILKQERERDVVNFFKYSTQSS